MRLLNNFRNNISKSKKVNRFRERIRTTLENVSTLNEWQQLFFKENNFEDIVKKNFFISNLLVSIPEIRAINDKESFENAQNYNYSVVPQKLRELDNNEPFIYLKNDDLEEEIFITVITNNRDDLIEVYISRESENHIYEQTRIFDLNTGREIKEESREENEI